MRACRVGDYERLLAVRTITEAPSRICGATTRITRHAFGDGDAAVHAEPWIRRFDEGHIALAAESRSPTDLLLNPSSMACAYHPISLATWPRG